MTSWIFVAAIVAAFVIITWLLAKSKSAGLIADLQSKLEAEKLLRGELEHRLAAVTNAHTESEANLATEQQQTAVLKSQMQMAEAVKSELREVNKSLQENIINLNQSVTQAQQEKLRLEIELANSNRFISELHEQEKQLSDERNNLRQQNENLKEENATLKAKHGEALQRLKEQQEFINDANAKLKDAFHSLSAQALRNNNESFVTLAKSTLATQFAEAKGEFDKKQQAIDAIVKPLSESLGKFDTKIQELEKVRMEQHGQINQYIQGVQQSTEKLQKETNTLVSALKTSHTRGRYGEIGLRRVVEVAGMTEHCDFHEQQSVSSEDGVLRPDMTIRLPERKTIVVDSKLPLAAYWKVFETDNEEERKSFLTQHAIAVREHLKKLSLKAYWSQFPDSPDWVVFYMQLESSFGAALQADPTLIEDAIKNRVILATPTTLITLLRTVGFVWQQVKIAENIEEIRDAGIGLFNRTANLLNHFAGIGGSLKNAVTNYNKAVASLESRFLPQAKKLHSLGSAYIKDNLPEIVPIESSVRELVSSKELIGSEDIAEKEEE